MKKIHIKKSREKSELKHILVDQKKAVKSCQVSNLTPEDQTPLF